MSATPIRQGAAAASFLLRASLALSTTFASACAAIEAAEPQADEPLLQAKPAGVNITKISATGSGCPSGTSQGECRIEADGVTRCNINFAAYTISIDNELSAPQSKNCIVNLMVESPAGTQVAISRFVVRAMGRLTKGSTLTLRAFAGFVGYRLGDTEERKEVVPGPFPVGNQSSQVVLEAPDELRWAPCSYAGNLKITTSLQLTSTGGSGIAELIGAATHLVNRFEPEDPGVDIDVSTRTCQPEQ